MTSPNIKHLQDALLNGTAAAPSSDFDLNNDQPPQRPLRAAAVLVPVVERPAGLHVMLTKRPDWLRSHPGQVAFPGGKVDDTDASIDAAALREANEEIGLQAGQAEILGYLPNHITVTAFDVHPVVAQIDPSFVPVPEPGEVAEVFEVPLAHVTRPDHFLVEGRQYLGVERYYYTVPYGPYYIWGATARMLRMLADRMAA